MTAVPARRQRGAALLALVAVIMVGGLWWLLVALTPVNRLSLEREHNARVLAIAKQAVLGWVVANAADTADPNPGKLPCPEALGNFTLNPPAAMEGVVQGFCAGAATAVGRLPWKSLGIDKPHDASGEVLWLVVAAGWKRPNNTAPEPALGLNSNSPDVLTVDGKANAAVAAIIAPGRRLNMAPNADQVAQNCAAGWQARTTFPPVNSLEYLECFSVAGASLRTNVVHNAVTEVSNDQIVLITAAEVMAAIEPVVAKRIESTVVPQLTAMYAAAEWGTTAANPILPFPALFANPQTSTYRGASTEQEGLLPLTSNCATAGDPRCEQGAPFVTWNTAGGAISVTKRSGTANITASSCAASTASSVSCTVTYSRTCGGLGCILGCACPATLEASVLASANNIGMSMRTFTETPITGFSGALVSSNRTIGTTGAAAIDVRGNLPSDTCTAFSIFGLLFPCTAGGTATLTVPITVFPDHPLVSPAPTDAWYWYIGNNWHQLTYYAVSPAHLPSGAVHNCTTPANCITVKMAGTGDLTNRKAVLVLAGRSVNGSARPSSTLANYLEGGNSSTLDRTFAHDRFGKAFNDRVISVANY
jgi:hypothetical protein